jgi:hypothetical protein
MFLNAVTEILYKTKYRMYFQKISEKRRITFGWYHKETWKFRTAQWVRY